jgi:glycosyltransferase involved in cell wall biosynthesis
VTTRPIVVIGMDRPEWHGVVAKRTPKLLVIGPYPPPYSGPELGTKLLLDSDVSRVFRVRFLNTNVRRDNAAKGRVDGRLVLAFILYLARLLRAMLVFRPDVAYHLITATQMGWCGRDLWFLLICRIFRTKAMIHLRGGHLQHNMRRFHPVVRFLMRRLCASVSLALVQAECLRRQFEGLVAPERVRVLSNAVEVDTYAVAEHASRPTVLFLGHATKAKGYCDLVRSIPLVAGRIPNVRFIVAGSMHTGTTNVFVEQTSGAEIEYENPFDIHKWIRSSPYAANYEYLGVVAGEVKLRLLRDAAVFVLPSYSEGFSRALLEAMAVGKAVVCTPVGAHAEVIQEGVNGFLVTPGDERALAQRVVQLLTDSSLRERIGAINAHYVRERFSAESVAGRFVEYVNELSCEEA